MQKKSYSLFIIFMLFAPLQFIDAAKFIAEELLKLHNDQRKHHNTDILRMDLSLSALAMETAINLAKNIKYVPNEDYGINKYWIIHEDYSSIDEVDAKTVFNHWYKEGENYNYFSEPKNMEIIKNFTQILWKSTTMIGIASARVELKTYIVALYSPKGNKCHHYKYNIMRPKDLLSYHC